MTFNDSAQVAVPLSQDREALTGALTELTATGGTNIAAGVAYAALELSSNRRNPDAQPVIVLLSDGLARGDNAEAIAAATLAKEQGIRVITIGLGANVNAALLKEMASAGDAFYLAPTKEDLALIYERITDTLVCEPVGT